jgi:DNA invertase Pin-like site-specific DNA recombinase
LVLLVGPRGDRPLLALGRLKRAASRVNGTKFGRPRKVDDADHIATARRMKADGHTDKDIAKYLGVSRATLYRYLGSPDAVLVQG